MENIYQKIWELAKPYYTKGRPRDIMHIEWMMKNARLVCENEDIDESILMPLVILHDIGYSEISTENPLDLDVRKKHMEEGEKIAQKILEEINYDNNKISKIAELVSVHDSWALGNDQNFNENIVLGTFNDLDFMWMASPEGFQSGMKMLNKSQKEMLEYLEKNEKLSKRPFATKTTENLFKNYISERRTQNVDFNYKIR